MDFSTATHVGSVNKIRFSSRHEFPVYLKSEDRECSSCLTFPVLISGQFIFLPNFYTQYFLLLIFFSVSDFRFKSVWWYVSLIQIFDGSFSCHCYSLRISSAASQVHSEYCSSERNIFNRFPLWCLFISLGHTIMIKN